MKESSVRRRSLLSIFVMCSVLIIMMVSINVLMLKMEKNANALDKDITPKVDAIQKFRYDFQLRVSTVRGALAYNNFNLMTDYLRQEQENKKQVELLNNLFKEDKDINEMVKASIKYDEIIREKIIPLADQEKWDEARTLVLGSDVFFYDARVQEFAEKQFVKLSEDKNTFIESFAKDSNDSQILTMIFGIVSIIVIMIMTTLNARMFTKPLLQFADLIENGQGDLTARLPMTKYVEYNRVAIGFNNLQQQTLQIIEEVKKSIYRTNKTTVKVDEIGKQTSDEIVQLSNLFKLVSEDSVKQVDTLQECSQAVEEISEGIQRVAESANVVSEQTSDAFEDVQNGQIIVKEATVQMETISAEVKEIAQLSERLKESSQQIERAITMITSISDQTNLLALNAAIEAARAGEHGKGFAVVAAEVRKLAEQSKVSASEIRQIIHFVKEASEKIVSSVDKGNVETEKGLQAVKQVGVMFKSVVSKIDQITAQMQEVSAVSEEISAGVEEINASLTDVVVISEETSKQSKTASNQIEQEAVQMENISNEITSLQKDARILTEIISQLQTDAIEEEMSSKVVEEHEDSYTDVKVG